ncbi:MAG TPA: hypothetical protein VFR81_29055, partial [Longimicrobium sp.]|nr:hypothetical protein [Longimicrobium sp.]
MAKAHTLTDNFNDDATDTGKWISFGSAREVNHRLEIHFDGSAASPYAGGYTSATTYDLTDSEVRVELVHVSRGGIVYLFAHTGTLDTGDVLVMST